MMDDLSKKVIEQYQADEKVMIQLFIHWCKNKQLDPLIIYKEAYPHYPDTTMLEKSIEEMVDDESIHVSKETLLHILEVFEQHELAYVVSNLK